MLTTTKVFDGKKAYTHSVYTPDEIINKKAIKQESKDKLVVLVKGVSYDADSLSMCYMSNVINIASMRYNSLVSKGTPTDEAYRASYLSSIGWKGSDNVPRDTLVEDIGLALELAMGEVANIIGV